MADTLSRISYILDQFDDKLPVTIQETLNQLCLLLHSTESIPTFDTFTTERVCSALIRVLTHSNYEVVRIASEIRISSFTEQVNIPKFILLQCIHKTRDCTGGNCFGYLSVISQLLKRSTPAAATCYQSDFLQFLTESITNSSNEINKCLSVEIFTHLCFDLPNKHFELCFVKEIGNCILNLLSTAVSRELTFKMLVLLRKLLATSHYSKYVIQTDKWSPSLLSKFKQILTVEAECVQLPCVQCLTILVASNPHCLTLILASDITGNSYNHCNPGMYATECLLQSLCTHNTELVVEILIFLKTVSKEDEFYNGGFQPVLQSLKSAIDTKNNHIIVLGFQLLSTIFENKLELFIIPAALHSIISSFLSVITYSLQTTTDIDVVKCITSTVSNLLNTNVSLSVMSLETFLPPLASVLQNLDNYSIKLSFTRCTTLSQQILSVCSVLYRLSQLLGKYHSSNSDFSYYEVEQFLLNSVEEVLVPIVLILGIDSVYCTKYLHLFFKILCIVIQWKCSAKFMLRLIKCNIIEFTLEARDCLIQLCDVQTTALIKTLVHYYILSHLADEANEVLACFEMALPRLTSSLMDCSKLLCSKINKELQVAILCLLHIELNFQNLAISMDELQNRLLQYLISNVDIHYLPFITINHLISLYVECYHSYVTMKDLNSDRILVNTLLLHLPERSNLFVNQVSFLLWAYLQVDLREYTKEWLQSWLTHLPTMSCIDYLLNGLSNHNELIEDSISLLDSGKHECLESNTCLLKRLLENYSEEAKQWGIIKRLELLLISDTSNEESRIRESRLVSGLRILNDSCLISNSNVAVCCQVIKLIQNSPVNSGIIYHALDVLYNVLYPDDHLQILQNQVLMNKILTIVLMQQDNTLSVSLNILTQLIQHKGCAAVNHCMSYGLSIPAILQLLLHKQESVKISSLSLWTAIFASNNGSIFSMIQNYKSTLLFLIINIIAEDLQDLNKAAVYCLQAFLQCDVILPQCFSKEWSDILNNFIKVRFQSSVVPVMFMNLLK